MHGIEHNAARKSATLKQSHTEDDREWDRMLYGAEISRNRSPEVLP